MLTRDQKRKNENIKIKTMSSLRSNQREKHAQRKPNGSEKEYEKKERERPTRSSTPERE